MNYLNDRRSGKDRRKSKQPVSFPLRDSNGEYVLEERRSFVERRTEGLELTVSKMPQKEFEEYFKKFQENPNAEDI